MITSMEKRAFVMSIIDRAKVDLHSMDDLTNSEAQSELYEAQSAALERAALIILATSDEDWEETGSEHKFLVQLFTQTKPFSDQAAFHTQAEAIEFADDCVNDTEIEAVAAEVLDISKNCVVYTAGEKGKAH